MNQALSLLSKYERQENKNRIFHVKVATKDQIWSHIKVQYGLQE